MYMKSFDNCMSLCVQKYVYTYIHINIQRDNDVGYSDCCRVIILL